MLGAPDRGWAGEASGAIRPSRKRPEAAGSDPGAPGWEFRSGVADVGVCGGAGWDGAGVDAGGDVGARA